MYCITKRCADYNIVLPSIQCEWSLYRDAAGLLMIIGLRDGRGTENVSLDSAENQKGKNGRRPLATSVPDQGDRS